MHSAKLCICLPLTTLISSLNLQRTEKKNCLKKLITADFQKQKNDNTELK